jgi:rod shape-determining protein MreB
MARDLAIDLGTANTLVYRRGRGVVLNEPTVIALDQRTGNVLAVGNEAREMIGRTPGDVVAERPLRHGAITDFDVTQRVFRMLLGRSRRAGVGKPKVILCVPTAITEVERRAVAEAARRAGAGEVYLIDQPMAAAIGCGLPIDEPTGNLVIDIGGGTTESALVSLGSVIATHGVRVGGFDLDAAIQNYVRQEYRISLGDRTAEEIKLAIGSAWPTDEDVKVEVRGRDVKTGLGKIVILAPEEVRAATRIPLREIVDSVKACLGKAPPELAHDVITTGMTLVGGGALLRGLDQHIASEIDVEARVAENPLEAVVRGAGMCLEKSSRELGVVFKND